MPEALCGGWPLLRAASVERYAPPEGGEMEKMTNKGGRGYSPAFDVLVRDCFVHNP